MNTFQHAIETTRTGPPRLLWLQGTTDFGVYVCGKQVATTPVQDVTKNPQWRRCLGG